MRSFSLNACAPACPCPSQEEYLALKGTPLPEGHFRTDGHFKGWVNPQVAKELGLAASAAEAWEQGGGGKFNRRVKRAGKGTA